SASLMEQYASFGTSTTDVSATGPTGLKDVDWRIDGEYHTTDGFRHQAGDTGEILAALSWRPVDHDVELRLEHHHFPATRDSIGIPFSPPNGVGDPLAVPVANTYYTPYAFADQNLERAFLSDAWKVNDHLTVNLRGAISGRNVDLARNSGGSVSLV